MNVPIVKMDIQVMFYNCMARENNKVIDQKVIDI